MSLSQCKHETSISQYYLWMEYIDYENNVPSKQDYYLAQIAAEIRQSWVKENVVIKISDFLLSFVKKKFKHKDISEDKSFDIKTETQNTKNFFFALTGYSKKNKDLNKNLNKHPNKGLINGRHRHR